MPVERKVAGDFPHSQHRPVILNVGVSIPVVRSTPRPRWNFKKANWDQYAQKLDQCIRFIPPEPENYNRFIGAVISAANKYIPRGYRKEYIPGWNEHSEHLYEEFKESGDQEVADNLLHSLDTARRDRWIETVENTDFHRSSRKAWTLLRNLGGSTRQNRPSSQISANQIANYIAETSRSRRDKEHTIEIKRKLKELRTTTPHISEYSQPFEIKT